MTAVRFREEPVDLSTFITSPRYLGLPRLSSAQFVTVQLAEKIFDDDTYGELAASACPATARYFAELGSLPMVNYIIAQVGQGAGKDLMAAIIAARVGYLLSCCASPQEAVGLTAISKIHLLNCAASAPQANEVFFSYLTGMVSVEAAWFARWFASRPKAEKAGVLARSINFGQSVIALSGHSDAATQQGLNLLLAVADEIDEFETDEVWDMACSSAPSRFARQHKLVALSWPRRTGSKIQTLTWRGRELGIAEGWCVIGPASTFDVNPTKSEADFARFAQQNPALYAARYLCRPQESANPVFPNEGVISASFTTEPRPRVRVVRYERAGAGWQPEWEISRELLVPYAGTRYWCHIDASRVKDRTAVAMCHVAEHVPYTDVAVGPDSSEYVRTGTRPRVVLDFLLTVAANMTTTPPRPIQPGWIIGLIRELKNVRHFNIEVVSTDFYGMPFYQEPLTEQLGIEVRRLTTDTAAGEIIWEQLSDTMYDGRLSGPYDPVLIRELRQLTRNPRSGKIDHPSSGSKDAADAVACAVHGAILLGGAESGQADGKGFDFGPGTSEPIGGWPLGMAGGMPSPLTDLDCGEGLSISPLGGGDGFRPHH